MPDFDAIIIGTGQARPSLAFRLLGAGMKVAVVERRHLRQYRLHPDQGLSGERLCRPDRAVRHRVWCDDQRRENTQDITLYRGHAQFASPQAVAIAGERRRCQCPA